MNFRLLYFISRKSSGEILVNIATLDCVFSYLYPFDHKIITLYAIVGDRSQYFLLYTIVGKVVQTYTKAPKKVKTHVWSKQKNP